MQKSIEVENIEEIRHQEGIDDVELWKEIGKLQSSDIVRLTLRISPTAFETVAVRITSIRGSAFRGKLVSKPVSSGLSELHAGSALAFTASQIHSVVHGMAVSGRSQPS